MTKRRQATQVRRDQAFKGRQFTAEVILWAVRWYLMFPISCHVRFQGLRMQNFIRFSPFRLMDEMQACAVEGGH
jgi:hypothetical protein